MRSSLPTSSCMLKFPDFDSMGSQRAARQARHNSARTSAAPHLRSHTRAAGCTGRPGSTSLIAIFGNFGLWLGPALCLALLRISRLTCIPVLLEIFLLHERMRWSATPYTEANATLLYTRLPTHCIRLSTDCYAGYPILQKGGCNEAFCVADENCMSEYGAHPRGSPSYRRCHTILKTSVGMCCLTGVQHRRPKEGLQ